MRVYLTNFGYCLAGTFSSLTAARAAGETAGFEFSVLGPGGAVLGFWSPVGGWVGYDYVP
jgi:hypothetical protein